MRQFVAFLILLALFVVLVGTRFRASDGDRLATVARLVGAKLRKALPPDVNLAAPVDALRRELPTQPADAVRARIATDRRLSGQPVVVIGEGSTVRLRGVVVDASRRSAAVALAESTVGVEVVVNELAVPDE